MFIIISLHSTALRVAMRIRCEGSLEGEALLESCVALGFK